VLVPTQGIERSWTERDGAHIGSFGFIDSEHRQRHGKIIRLNDTAVTLECDGQKWRVSYSYLHGVLDSHSL
jgi:hypothetical protein